MAKVQIKGVLCDLCQRRCAIDCGKNFQAKLARMGLDAIRAASLPALPSLDVPSLAAPSFASPSPAVPALPSRITTGQAELRPATPSRAWTGRALPALPRRAVPSLALPHRAMPRPALPRQPCQPCRAEPSRTAPSRAAPYPSVTSRPCRAGTSRAIPRPAETGPCHDLLSQLSLYFRFTLPNVTAGEAVSVHAHLLFLLPSIRV